MTLPEILERLSKLRGHERPLEMQTGISDLIGDLAAEAQQFKSPRRTLELGDTVIVLQHVRAVRVEHLPAATTYVWLESVGYPFTLKGDHRATIAGALEAET